VGVQEGAPGDKHRVAGARKHNHEGRQRISYNPLPNIPAPIAASGEMLEVAEFHRSRSTRALYVPSQASRDSSTDRNSATSKELEFVGNGGGGGNRTRVPRISV